MRRGGTHRPSLAGMSAPRTCLLLRQRADVFCRAGVTRSIRWGKRTNWLQDRPLRLHKDRLCTHVLQACLREQATVCASPVACPRMAYRLPNARGRCLSPRRTKLPIGSSCSWLARRMSVQRASMASRAMRVSSRARGAPRQKWMP